jgi:DNA-binding NtrC family response regulator
MSSLQAIKQRFEIIGRSELLDRALDTAMRVANTDLTVLISGESGVGKEIFSTVIHGLSNRKHNKFIAINCGAIPSGTINSELFGHEKGAFTGATSERKGYFETVSGGTIFLDEIGEMPLDTQSYLLRILESGEFIRVGSSQTLKTDVRVIAATNVNLLDRVKNGKFREDLFYRLNTVPIRIPSLKERKEDIYMLFRKFANDFADKYKTDTIRLDEKAQLLIENYSWPGNIRELKNVVEQLSVLTREKHIDAEMLIDFVPNITKNNLPIIRPRDGTGESGFQEREILYKLLFDMKSDLNDLKQLVFELIKSNNLSVPDIQKVRELNVANTPVPASLYENASFETTSREQSIIDSPDRPIILTQDNIKPYQKHEEVEENLSIELMEKDLIKKALKKHNNRRKDAALELGISERTLYRKIKQYDISS